MATIGSLGVGSGMDLGGILEQLMEIKSRPLYDIQHRQSELKAEISANASLKSVVSSFQDAVDKLRDPAAFNSFDVGSTDEAVLTATTTADASIGNYEISVTQLAKAYKAASTRLDAAQAADVTGGAAGTLDITLDPNGLDGGPTLYSVSVASGTSLEALRDQINADTNNPGITASIITEGGGSRLMLSSNETGAASELSIDSSALGDGSLFTFGAPGSGQAEVVSVAQDAQFSIDSFAVTTSTNTVSSVLQGVTINLKGAGTSNLSISRDDGATADLAQDFVDAYNTLRDEISSMRNKGTIESSFLRQIESAFINESAQEAGLAQFQYLFQVGISRDQEGKLELDRSEFLDALGSNLSDVEALFTDSAEGFAVRLYNQAETILGFNGTLDTREESLNTRIDYLEASEERMQVRLDLVRQRLTQQFTDLDTTMSQLTSTSTWLSGQLAGLSG